MGVLLLNNYNDDFLTEDLKKNAAILLHLAGKENHELSLLVTTDSEIQKINTAWRQKNTPTNVLSFPLNDDDTLHPMLGDIIISIDTAKREAETKKQPLEDYMSRLLIHGFVHLLGYDHEKSAEAYDEMLAVEQDFLQKLTAATATQKQGETQ
jgi:probable rRNA maturation factor